MNCKKYLLYVTINHEDIENDLADFFDLWPYDNSEIIMLVIDNSKVEKKSFKSSPDKLEYTYIKGEDSAFDFSAWDIGLEYLKTKFQLNENDVIIFLNDSFNKSYGKGYLKLFKPHLDLAQLRDNEIVGYVDDFPKSAEIKGFKFDSWIRSNFFFGRWIVISKLCPFVDRDFDSLFTHYYEDFWIRPERFFSSNYVAYMSSWLFGKMDPNFPEYRLNWARSTQLTLENWSDFVKKALAIHSEHLLSAKAQYSGINLRAVNNISTEVNRHVENYYIQQKKMWCD